ncbi:MAG: hypothetical protein COT88_00340 [Candidatus Colwellbacteria bacterium CG10_big_fil_rev_8_21_14_0_10_41_28]|uniref:Uncharacterized protein n=1 Tax=Candidatus Colwellbacteria bacterium CG10_big_fil_rev_8_21_14_0_10_41_28 TaxID=1974539 RepID=A0A2H0VK24_9BACT|nr:MAG: hypothetical protein COT88_00340 [Candidatus Colwellbacteria bacterium CG10_big_fil_rev_8_21_14_0_10_41_28]
MAFEVEQKSNTKNIFGVMGIVIAVFVVIGGLYLVFFSSPVQEEQVVPTGFSRVNQLSQVNLNVSQFNEDSIYKSLKLIADDLVVEEQGRDNPFAPF